MEVDKGVVVGICIEDLKAIFVAPKPSEVLLRFKGSSPLRALTGPQSGHRIGDTVRARQSFSCPGQPRGGLACTRVDHSGSGSLRWHFPATAHVDVDKCKTERMDIPLETHSNLST